MLQLMVLTAFVYTVLAFRTMSIDLIYKVVLRPLETMLKIITTFGQ